MCGRSYSVPMCFILLSSHSSLMAVAASCKHKRVQMPLDLQWIASNSPIKVEHHKWNDPDTPRLLNIIVQLTYLKCAQNTHISLKLGKASAENLLCDQRLDISHKLLS